jgi:ribosomal-protein-alanine N-acetyltransferase
MPLSEMLVKRTTLVFFPFEPHCFRILSKCVKIKDNKMSNRLSVHPARASDLPAILAIETASFRSDAYDRNLFAEFLHKCGGLFLVAMWGTKVAGYAISCINPRGAELVSIAVLPDHRKRGVASALMDSTLRRLRRRQVGQLTLMVKVSNTAALSFYERYGFRRIRRVRRYYEDGSDGFLFVRVL